MASPTSDVGVLREWNSTSSPSSFQDETKPNDVVETPVVATLVETIPRIYKQGNVLFQNAYGQVGHHLNESFRNMNMISPEPHHHHHHHHHHHPNATTTTTAAPSDRYLATIPSSRSGFEVQMMYDDVADTGEYQYINGELMQVISIEDSEDEMYEQAMQSRQGPGNKLRKFFSRRGCREREHPKNTSGNGTLNSNNTKNLRGRKGSRENRKLRRQRSNRTNVSNAGRFPIPQSNGIDESNVYGTDIRLPFASQCIRQDIHPSRRGSARASAPHKQKMSRAAANMMEEVDVTNECEVSDLGTDVERDPLSLSHSYAHTDTDIGSSFDEATNIRSPPSKDESATSSRTPIVSFINYMEEVKNNVLGDGMGELEVEKDTDTDTEVRMNGKWTSTKVRPILHSKRKGTATFRGERKSVSFEGNKKRGEYEARLKNLAQLSQLYTEAPTPPRKMRPRTSEESDPGVVLARISTPPRHAFKHLSPPQNFVVKRRRARKKDTYNNTLKVVFVGSPNSGKTSLVNALLQNNKKPKKRKKSVDVNIKAWSPAPLSGERQVKFNLWDLPGGNVESGAHHSTQSLFFSSNSLYVIVWDMSLGSTTIEDHLSPDESYESDCDSEYEEAIMNERRDQVIERDIDEQVMYWIDLLTRSGLSNCAILPVVTFKQALSEDEIDHRCGKLMQHLVKLELDRRQGSDVPQLVFDSKGNIPRLSSISEDGEVLLQSSELQSCLMDIANSRNGSKSAFKHHFESKLCAVTVHVQDILNDLRVGEDESGNEIDVNIVSSQELLVKLTEDPPDVENFSHQLIHDALNFLTSIGSIMYYGTMNTICTRPDYLQDYVVLNPKWLSAALSLTLRSDPSSALNMMRQTSKKGKIGIEKLKQSLPILSASESVDLWGHTDSIRTEGKRIKPGDNLTNFYTFLQQLCEHSGMLVPFTISTQSNAQNKKKCRKSRKKETFYLLPMLADQVPAEIWSYKVKEPWKTTLCNSYIFSENVPCSFMDKVAVSVVKDILELPITDPSLKIQQIMYWKTAMYIKVSEEFFEGETKYAHVTEMFLHLIENDSPFSVNSNNQSSTGRKLIVSAKGLEGGWGEKIWKHGYGIVLDSVDSLVNMLFPPDSVQREVICPHCLLNAKPSEAAVWDRDEICHDDECIMCPNGHETHTKLVLGPLEDDDCASIASGFNSVYSTISGYSALTNNSARSNTHVNKILPAIVIVALWDKSKNQIIRVGSGFIADNKKGLIVTASHTLYNYGEDARYDCSIDEKFFGLPNATAIIGTHHGNDSAVFTYCADVIASDVYNVDGCVLQIKTKFERPVELDRNHLTQRSEYPITTRLKQERLQGLKMTSDHLQREEEVRVIGFRQTGEGILEKGSQINRTACVNKGFVCNPNYAINHQNEDCDESQKKFLPRQEIIVNCGTGEGNSGGPFVNESGEVIGILSRADPVETQRCYLTPSVELKKLLKEAKQKCKESEEPLLAPLEMELF